MLYRSVDDGLNPLRLIRCTDYRLPRAVDILYDGMISTRSACRHAVSRSGKRQVSVMLKDAYRKTTAPFWSDNGVFPPTPQWQESNCALAGLLANHHRILEKAIAVAVEIRRGLDELAPLMAALCNRTCRFCPEPCCINNLVWIDFRDLLFLHLTEEPVPPSQAASLPGYACPFLSHKGCRLPPRMRPWMCIQYICPTQQTILKSKGRTATAALLGKIKRIENNRIRMETEVIQQIKRRRQTSPSSSPACSG